MIYTKGCHPCGGGTPEVDRCALQTSSDDEGWACAAGAAMARARGNAAESDARRTRSNLCHLKVRSSKISVKRERIGTLPRRAQLTKDDPRYPWPIDFDAVPFKECDKDDDFDTVAARLRESISRQQILQQTTVPYDNSPHGARNRRSKLARRARYSQHKFAAHGSSLRETRLRGLDTTEKGSLIQPSNLLTAQRTTIPPSTTAHTAVAVDMDKAYTTRISTNSGLTTPEREDRRHQPENTTRAISKRGRRVTVAQKPRSYTLRHTTTSRHAMEVRLKRATEYRILPCKRGPAYHSTRLRRHDMA
ncbi:hypothetical protein D9611_009826 [Ephemerocybe angulata]|uniref:Uncharacterized protein n=1 Tax=Ephemerocybe angulata TaxID=980116 RepID=A0A8H5FJQ4_9AGAR|nr:hypothetical protein D9611_009826 [Tulosesus angulatus]